MSIDQATQTITADLLKRYQEAQVNNKTPSMAEMVAIAVQLAGGTRALDGAQKMTVVKAAVAATIKELPISTDEKVRLQAAAFVVEDLAETTLSLLKANSQLSGCLTSCFSNGLKVNIPFPLL